jgi:hypothetical protein
MSDKAVAGEEFLEHFGVKGMKWGVRKDRVSTNVSTLKVAGSKQKLKKSGTDSLSNKELQDLATRMNLEVQVNRLNKETKSSGKKFVSKLIEPPKPKEIRRLIADEVKRKK